MITHKCELVVQPLHDCTITIELFSNHKEYNLGIGKGVSVLEFIKMFKEATSYDIPFIIGDRRLGDVDVLVCDGSTALKELGWEPKLDFKSMCS